jgi:hypothetical protein
MRSAARKLPRVNLLACLCMLRVSSVGRADEPRERIHLHVSWGHRTPSASPFVMQLRGDGISILGASANGLETGEGLEQATWKMRASGGDVDGGDDSSRRLLASWRHDPS